MYPQGKGGGRCSGDQDLCTHRSAIVLFLPSIVSHPARAKAKAPGSSAVSSGTMQRNGQRAPRGDHRDSEQSA